jgi:hypothetical protein
MIRGKIAMFMRHCVLEVIVFVVVNIGPRPGQPAVLTAGTVLLQAASGSGQCK